MSTQEQNTPREPGFYWVRLKLNSEWTIRYWAGDYWFEDDDLTYQIGPDKLYLEIDERKIVRV